VHHAEQVHVHHAPEVRGVTIAEFAHDGDRSVVEHKIQPPVSGHNIAHNLADIGLGRHVKRCRFSTSSAVSNACGNFLGLAAIDVRDYDERAVHRESFGQGAAKAGCTTRHEGDVADHAVAAERVCHVSRMPPERGRDESTLFSTTPANALAIHLPTFTPLLFREGLKLLAVV